LALPKREQVEETGKKLYNEESHNLYCGYEIKENGVRGRYNTHGRNEKCAQSFSPETWKRPLVTPRLNERIILHCI
jgi:hypothetical protein